jgi:hypothetical protein
MKQRMVVAAFLAVALLCGYALAGEGLKSGPQVGDKYAGPFHPLNVTNCDKPDRAGQKSCFV